MIYRLEEHIPIDAEQLTADFLPPVGGKILGMAVETVIVRTIIDSLTEARIETVAVCPTAMLGLWDSLSRNGAENSDYVIITDRQCVDVFRITDRQPSAWYTTSPQPSELIRCFQADMLAEPVENEHPSVLLIGPLEASVASALEQETSVKILYGGEEQSLVPAAGTAGAILAGQAAGWVNFRRDALALPDKWGRFAGLIRAAVILACLLPLVLAAGFYWRGSRYETIAKQYQEKQVAEFQTAYPNQPVPTGIGSRFESQLKAVAAKSGSGFDLPDRPCALETLSRMTANLPPAVRLRIVEMRMDTAGILIEGQTRNHTGAESIARTLKRGGFLMGPPSTEHLVAGGVAFTLIGTFGTSEQQAQTGGRWP